MYLPGIAAGGGNSAVTKFALLKLNSGERRKNAGRLV